jgi:ribosome maturation factor RimP
VKTELEEVVSKVVRGMSLDLVELRIGGGRRRPVIDVRAERLDGEGITVDDCARLSRVIEKEIDAALPDLGDYVLEVSSPGLERPLKRVSDWRRFAGRTVSVVAEQLGGRRELELAGVEGEEGAETAVLRDKRGAEVRVPLAGVKEARLVFHWKR